MTTPYGPRKQESQRQFVDDKGRMFGNQRMFGAKGRMFGSERIFGSAARGGGQPHQNGGVGGGACVHSDAQASQTLENHIPRPWDQKLAAASITGQQHFASPHPPHPHQVQGFHRG